MIDDCLARLNDVVDPEHVLRSEERMLAATRYQPVDRLPRVVHCPVDGWPAFTYREGFEDPAKMLLNELASVWVGAQVRDDRAYTIRANYGVGGIASMLGCEVKLTDDNTMPWLFPLEDGELDRILDAGEVDIEAGLGARVFETERFYIDALSRHEALARTVHVYVSDTQGPFDTAHLVMGHKIYTEIYDNPARVHRLLELVTDAYIRFTRAQREIIGEFGDTSYHSTLRIRGAVRICDDSGINLSTDFYREFCKPYNQRILAEFGGGWVHYCGGGQQILQEVLSTEGITGINFGNPERQDISLICKEAASRETAVLGWPTAFSVPEWVTTGMTLVESAADLEAGRAIAAG